MQYILAGLMRFIMSGPLALLGGAAAVLILGYFRQISEVNLRAQLDFPTDYELILEDGSTTHRALMVPLMGADTDEPIGVAVYATDSFQFADMDPMALLAKTQGFGEAGPILHLNGEISSIGKWDEIVRDSFSEQGRTIPATCWWFIPTSKGAKLLFRRKPEHPFLASFQRLRA